MQLGFQEGFLEASREELDSIRLNKDTQAEVLQVLKMEALVCGETVDSKRQADEVSTQMFEMQTRIATLELTTMDSAELEESLQSSIAKYEKLESNTKMAEETIENYVKTVKCKRAQLKRLERTCCEKVKSAFERVLKSRQFKARLFIYFSLCV